MLVYLLAEIYAGLAEAMAWPPADWLSTPGRGWPLYGSVVSLAAQSRDVRWQQAVLKIGEAHPAGIQIRQKEYRKVFHPRGGAPIRLYECQHMDGRFPGPATFTVKSLYDQTGLDVEGAEMPDHASVELAFLAYLCKQEARGDAERAEWRSARRLFTRNHAGKWLPEVGRVLMRSGYPTWEALGQLLIVSLNISRRPQRSDKASMVLPTISDFSRCNLCGFCVQVCPAQALRIHEDETTTELWMLPEKCVGCRKCEQACDSGALTPGNVQAVDPVVLRRSKRAHCPLCGEPTVSQAELDAVAARLGEHPAWLDTCLACR